MPSNTNTVFEKVIFHKWYPAMEQPTAPIQNNWSATQFYNKVKDLLKYHYT